MMHVQCRLPPPGPVFTAAPRIPLVGSPWQQSSETGGGQRRAENVRATSCALLFLYLEKGNGTNHVAHIKHTVHL